MEKCTDVLNCIQLAGLRRVQRCSDCEIVSVCQGMMWGNTNARYSASMLCNSLFCVTELCQHRSRSQQYLVHAVVCRTQSHAMHTSRCSCPRSHHILPNHKIAKASDKLRSLPRSSSLVTGQAGTTTSALPHPHSPKRSITATGNAYVGSIGCSPSRPMRASAAMPKNVWKTSTMSSGLSDMPPPCSSCAFNMNRASASWSIQCALPMIDRAESAHHE